MKRQGFSLKFIHKILLATSALVIASFAIFTAYIYHDQSVSTGAALAGQLKAVGSTTATSIANWLNGAIALGAPVFWFASGLDLWPGVAMQIGIALATFAVLSVLFAIKAMGGGDVKLLTALSLWIEPMLFLKLLIIMALVTTFVTTPILSALRPEAAVGAGLRGSSRAGQ